MCREIPVKRVDDKHRDVREEPIWLKQNEIIKTTSERISGKTLTIVETSAGIYQITSNPEDMAHLLEMDDSFIVVDRGSAVNVNFVDGIDDEFKLLILKEANGKVDKALISGVLYKTVVSILRKLNII